MKTIQHLDGDIWKYGALEADSDCALIDAILGHCTHTCAEPEDSDEPGFPTATVKVMLDGECLCEVPRWWHVGYDKNGEWAVSIWDTATWDEEHEDPDHCGLDDLAEALEVVLGKISDEKDWAMWCQERCLNALLGWDWPTPEEPDEEELASMIDFTEESEVPWAVGTVFEDVPVLAYRDKTGIRAIVRPGQDDTRDVAASIAQEGLVPLGGEYFRARTGEVAFRNPSGGVRVYAVLVLDSK